MILTLLEKDKMYTLHLPEKVSGKYYLDHINAVGKSEQIISAEGIEGKWILSPSVYAQFSDNSKEHIAEDGMVEIIVKRTFTKAVLIIESDEKAYSTFFKKKVSGECEITVGSHSQNTICYGSTHFPLIEDVKLSLSYKDNKFTITDCAGMVFVDGSAAYAGEIKAGTQIYAGGIKIVVGRDFICCNYEDYIASINGNILGDFPMPEWKPKDSHEIADDKTENLFYCSPRFCQTNEGVNINIELPPAKVATDASPAIFSIGPSLTMGMASVATAGFSVVNNINNGGSLMTVAPTMIMAGSMVLGSIMWPLISKGAEKRRNKKKERIRTVAYAEYIKNLQMSIENTISVQKNTIISSNPGMEELLRRIEYRDRSLWERVNGQNDFLSFSAGKGSVDADIKINFNEKKFSLESDPLYDLAVEFANKQPVIDSVPVTVSLKDDYILGIIGERSEAEEYLRDIIIQTAALQSYDEVKFVIITSEEDYPKWEFMRWLPHIISKSGDIRYIASDTEDMKHISSDLEKHMSEGTDCAYIVISCDRKLASKTSLVSKILSSQGYSGFSLIALYDEMKYLPKECKKIISISGNTAEIHDPDGSINSIEIYPHISLVQCEKSAVSLANIHLAKSDKSFELPNMITFMELMGAVRCEHLNCSQRWHDNNPVNSLKTPVGIDENGDVCYLDLHQDGHGPHGLVAGMTGSGKSEFIMTYILSMALNYSPAEVSFILIDYKGGGMSKAFKNLPHLAGMITNLDGSGISRALVSIESELKRREHVFAETGEKLEMTNLDIYKYQKLYRSGMVSEPMSHLFIVSDEFAELKSQQPEFMDKLISTARIGRSLGVHLILATQKPSGVVSDQIWSNSRFKVCLKVQDTADSVDMIKRPDAAALVNTGRFYLQVGYNEIFVMGQSAWCGAVYRPETESNTASDIEISVIDRCGRKIAQSSAVNIKSHKAEVESNTADTKNPSKQLDVILEYIRKTAETEGVSARPMWLPPLSEEIYLNDLSERRSDREAEFTHFADIAVYDAPEKQEQGLFSVSPLEDGNIAVYGSAGSGKASFITSMICSMAEKYSPDEVNFYIIDFGAETLIQLENLPHVGEVIVPSNADRINNLFMFIKRQANIRKNMFLDYNGDYHTYCAKKAKIPEIIVIINNYSAFNEYINSVFDTSLLQLGKLGISFVVTAVLVNSLGFSVLQNFRQKITMQLNDDTYSIILGKAGRLRPSPFKGRGLAQMADQVYEFQTAFVAPAENQSDYFNELCKRKNMEYSDIMALKVPVLPEYYTCDYVLSNKLDPVTLSNVPVGLSSVEAEPVYFDFTEKFTVIAHKYMFDSAAIQGVAEILSMYYGDKLTVIDCFDTFAKCDMKYNYVHGKEESGKFIHNIFEEALYRHNHYNDCVRDGKTAPEYEEKAILFCNISRFIEVLEPDRKDELVNMLERVGTKHNLRYIVYDKVNDLLSTLKGIKSFEERTNQNSYIWVGDGYSEQYILPAVKTSAKAEEVFNGGYIVSKKKISCVKLICSEVSKEEDDE